jgi:D-glycero-alpha-D-manno-heptose-7-phosphate kinase
MDYSWVQKKNTSQLVSNNLIDSIYETAKNSGALGGKILGGGGGGFFLIIAENKNQKKIINSLKKFKYVPIKFTKMGTEIIYKN